MLALLAALALQAAQVAPPPRWPTREGDVVLRNFAFHDGETLPQIRIHYTTLGAPHRNPEGQIDNAVMLLHGTGGDGKQFLAPPFADELYGPGQPLDMRKYWIVLPDNIGHGKSSKPSDGLRMRFPRYDYADMVEAQRRMLVEGLGVTHLRLIIGTSMGCMHAFVWGETHPNFASALMPLACEPIEMAGRNRMWRQLAIDGIEADPAWNHGNYRTEPEQGLRTAASLGLIAAIAPLRAQEHYPTGAAASAAVKQWLVGEITDVDANDTIYQLQAAWTYNPWPKLERITAPLMWVNSADDFVDPPSLPYPRLAIRRMKKARFRLIPETVETHGHGTFIWAEFWKKDLVELLVRSK